MASLYHKCVSELGLITEYMNSDLTFEKTFKEGDYTMVDLRENCKLKYKNTGLELVQCPFFEIEHTFAFYKKMITEARPGYDFAGKVVFDCGACCGLDAILFSKEVLRVICLEPDSKNFENLQLNTSDRDNITIIKKALFNHCGEIEFLSENTQGSMILGKTIDIPVEDLKVLRKSVVTKVQCTTLDEMMDSFGPPDIIKIDIEGSEYDLVGSMNKVLTHGSILIFEIHRRPNSSDHFNKLVEYIESFDYKVTLYSDSLLGDHISCVKK
jgi:FkbM family methyltransferase